MPAYLATRTRVIALAATAAAIAAFALRQGGAGSVLLFATTAVALAALAAMVSEATDQLGGHMGPGATGVLQSALGNLPEFFIGFFALRAGLLDVVRAALIGSILANTLLVLGLAFIAGGVRHGVQRFGGDQTRTMSTLLVLAVAALAIPTIATAAGGPAHGHATELSVVVSVVLLIVFVASIPFSLGRGRPDAGATENPDKQEATWPLAVTLSALLVSGIGAAIVSDWFVEALKPAAAALGMSETFAGLVVVAIAGNAVENVVGIRAMLADKGDLAISLILNSSLQVALALTPVLVIVSLFIGTATLTLVVSPLLVAAMALTTLLAAFVVVDGESTWLEGVALVGLYTIIAASVWWGAPIGG